MKDEVPFIRKSRKGKNSYLVAALFTLRLRLSFPINNHIVDSLGGTWLTINHTSKYHRSRLLSPGSFPNLTRIKRRFYFMF
ncbi:hypothetical protein CEXT_436701 [Caerostris extrusa]|uniref:Uncharacterized protein n=1 Tax=Caerostris extrusa TaxID=172846 RepID=A0AAV4XTN2_CAEEX|nr:hypothetical protein CEXT_436701 [Caerostris extrusa]